MVRLVQMDNAGIQKRLTFTVYELETRRRIEDCILVRFLQNFVTQDANLITMVSGTF